VNLVGRLVDSLGFSNPQERVKAVVDIPFPATLEKLEHYIGLTGWFRHHIPNFAGIAGPLQDRKTALLTAAQSYASKTHVTIPTEEELQAFHAIRKHFQHMSFMTHHNPERQLYIDLDALRAQRQPRRQPLSEQVNPPTDVSIPFLPLFYSTNSCTVEG
jgi:hypothetical protein